MRLVLSVAIAMLSLTTIAANGGVDRYTCTIEQVFRWDNAEFEPHDFLGGAFESLTIEFDVSSGQLELAGMDPAGFEVLSVDPDGNGLVAIRRLQGPRAYVFTTLRIKMSRYPSPFFYDNGAMLMTGLCEES